MYLLVAVICQKIKVDLIIPILSRKFLKKLTVIGMDPKIQIVKKKEREAFIEVQSFN